MTARRGRRLREAVRASHATVPRDFDLSGYAPVLPQRVSISSRFTVVAGLNGAGKTKLLEALAAEFGNSARLIAVHHLVAWLMRELTERHDVSELADEGEELTVDDHVLAAVRQVVRRDYETIRWYALELEDTPFGPIVGEAVIPYFTVAYGGSEYSMLEMGSGELAAHVLLWTLWYLRDTPDVVVLLDEPDAFFPPDSRETLLDHVADMSLRQRQAVVVATHSRELIEPASQHDGALLFLLRQPDAVTCYSARADVQDLAREFLFSRPAVALVAFVEDEAAAAFATELLKRIDPLLSRKTALYWVGGWGGLAKLREHLPRPDRPPRGLEFVMIADSDQEQLLKGNSLQKWPVVLLPGDGLEPDRLFEQAANAAPSSLGAALGKSEAAMDGILERLRGAEAHDWTDEFVVSADVDRPIALRALAVNLLDGPRGDELAGAFLATLKECGLRAFNS